VVDPPGDDQYRPIVPGFQGGSGVGTVPGGGAGFDV
jgi:hypothetical protein